MTIDQIDALNSVFRQIVSATGVARCITAQAMSTPRDAFDAMHGLVDLLDQASDRLMDAIPTDGGAS